MLMGYFNYHATAKRLIKQNKLISWHITTNHNGIRPALVLIFDDPKHPVMPIRKERWAEYTSLLTSFKQTP